MPNLFHDLDELGTSLKGAFNATRLRMEDDPAKRRAMEDEMLRKRREGEKRKSVFGGAGDAVEGRDADEGLDARKALDPNAAMDRRMREAEGEPLSMEALQEKQQRARQIVQRYQQGEPISDEDKVLVFQVVTDVVKGLAQQREQKLESQFGGPMEEEPIQQPQPV